MSAPVSPAARRRDVTATVILLAGAAVAGYGYLGLRAMAMRPIVRRTGEQALDRAFSYADVMYVGLGIMALGVCAVAWSFWRYRRHAQPPA